MSDLICGTSLAQAVIQAPSKSKLPVWHYQKPARSNESLRKVCWSWPCPDLCVIAPANILAAASGLGFCRLGDSAGPSGQSARVH